MGGRRDPHHPAVEPGWLTVRQTADRLGLMEEDVMYRIRKGVLVSKVVNPHVKKLRRRLVEEASVEKLEGERN